MVVRLLSTLIFQLIFAKNFCFVCIEVYLIFSTGFACFIRSVGLNITDLIFYSLKMQTAVLDYNLGYCWATGSLKWREVMGKTQPGLCLSLPYQLCRSVATPGGRFKLKLKLHPSVMELNISN